MRRLLGIMVVVLSGCSHGRPYVRADLAPRAAELPSAAEIVQRVILIGDAGAPALRGEPVLESLLDTANALADRTVVVFLGDNIYPAGLPAEGARGRQAAEQALTAQLAAIGNARAIFVPGNHDWMHGRTGGLAALQRQAAIVNARERAEFSPSPGCPGPSVHDLPGVRLVAVDTQWWLQGDDGGVECGAADTASVTAKLREALAPPDGRPVIVIGHHPLQSRGPHGGFFTLDEWIFPARMAEGRWRWLLVPLPVLGPLGRWLVRSDQDFVSSGNTELRRQLSAALATRPPLAYASGHDHSLQVFDGGAVSSLLLVSGLGSSSKATSVNDNESTLFAHQHPGYMVLDILRDRVLLRVIEPGAEPLVFAHEIAWPPPG